MMIDTCVGNTSNLRGMSHIMYHTYDIYSSIYFDLTFQLVRLYNALLTINFEFV